MEIKLNDEEVILIIGALSFLTKIENDEKLKNFLERIIKEHLSYLKEEEKKLR